MTMPKNPNDSSTPNHAQMISAVKGHDPYVRIGRRSFWAREFGYAVLVVVIVLLAFASFVVIAAALR